MSEPNDNNNNNNNNDSSTTQQQQNGATVSVDSQQQNGTSTEISPSSSSSSSTSTTSPGTTKTSILALFVMIAITYTFIPDNMQPTKPTVQHVFYYGWISAVSTGLGVLPLIFTPDLDRYWIGVSNAVASGMMAAASYSLIVEGCQFNEPEDTSLISSNQRTLIGIVLGLAFILCTKSFLGNYEEIRMGGMESADARRVLLIIFVMTLHSFAEGVGIGVSFGGVHGSELGVFISTSLAVHNVPEGLAVAIVLLPRKFSKLTASLWCVLTSFPQPLMAVPAFLFVDYFIPVLPIGLGFAGGAMGWVAFCELLIEAYEHTDMVTTGVISSLSLLFMLKCQGVIDITARS